MSKRFLNKNIKCFLEQSLPENILLESNTTKTLKESRVAKTSLSKEGFKGTVKNKLSTAPEKNFKEAVICDRFLSLYSNEESKSGIINRLRNQPLSGKDRLAKVEAQIIQQFLSKCVNQGKEPHGMFDNLVRGLETFPSVGDLDVTSSLQPNILMSIEQIRNILVFKRTQSYTYSEYKNRLQEAKKIRFLYGDISKRELKKITQKAKQLYGIPGENLLILLESRLDVILKRCGFFSSIKASRQSITHGRIKVNLRKVTFPGYQLKAGDLIKIEPRYPGLISKIKQADPLSLTSELATPGDTQNHSANLRAPLLSKQVPAITDLRSRFSQQELKANQSHLGFSDKEISFRHQNSYSRWYFSVFPSILNSLIFIQSRVIKANATNTFAPFLDPYFTKDKFISTTMKKKVCPNSYQQQNQVYRLSQLADLASVEGIRGSKSASDLTSRVQEPLGKKYTKKEVTIREGTFLEKFVENCGLILGFVGLRQKNLTKKYEYNFTFLSPHTKTTKYNWIGHLPFLPDIKRNEPKDQNKEIQVSRGVEASTYGSSEEAKNLPILALNRKQSKGVINVFLFLKEKNIKKLFACFTKSIQITRALKLKHVSKNRQPFITPFQNSNELFLHSDTATETCETGKQAQGVAAEPRSGYSSHLNESTLGLRSKPQLFSFSSFLSKYKIYCFFLLIKKKLFFSLHSLYSLREEGTDSNGNRSRTITLSELNFSRINRKNSCLGLQPGHSHRAYSEAGTEVSRKKSLKGKSIREQQLWSKHNQLFIEGSTSNKARNYPTPYNIQNSLSKKKTKPLHLEISYKSLCAIFLYSPQRIYSPALLDVDLLIKTF